MINNDFINKINNNENVIIPIENVDLQHSLKLINLQKESCKNLFISYINATVEEANNFNLEKFLNKYVEYEINFQDIILSILHENLGKEVTDKIYYGENAKNILLIDDFKEILIK